MKLFTPKTGIDRKNGTYCGVSLTGDVQEPSDTDLCHVLWDGPA